LQDGGHQGARICLGYFFSSSPWVGLPLCKVSCLLEKLNDSGGYLVFAALLIGLPNHIKYKKVNFKNSMCETVAILKNNDISANDFDQIWYSDASWAYELQKARKCKHF